MTPVGLRGSPAGDHCFSTAFTYICLQCKLPKHAMSMYDGLYDAVIQQSSRHQFKMAKTIKCEGTFVDCFVVV